MSIVSIEVEATAAVDSGDFDEDKVSKRVFQLVKGVRSRKVEKPISLQSCAQNSDRCQKNTYDMHTKVYVATNILSYTTIEPVFFTLT